jgi:hypothetical protein
MSSTGFKVEEGKEGQAVPIRSLTYVVIYFNPV